MVDHLSSFQKEYVGVASALFTVMFNTDSVFIQFHKMSHLFYCVSYRKQKTPVLLPGLVLNRIRLHLFKSITSPGAGIASVKTEPVHSFDI